MVFFRFIFILSKYSVNQAFSKWTFVFHIQILITFPISSNMTDSLRKLFLWSDFFFYLTRNLYDMESVQFSFSQNRTTQSLLARKSNMVLCKNQNHMSSWNNMKSRVSMGASVIRWKWDNPKGLWIICHQWDSNICKQKDCNIGSMPKGIHIYVYIL